MTGYGKGNFSYQGLEYLLEIHSVNRKHLDINIVFPKELLPLDIVVRKWITKKVKRGQVTCRISRDLSKDVEPEQLFDFSAAKAAKNSLEKLAEEVGFSKDSITCAILLDQMEKMPKAREKDLGEFEKALKVGFDIAIENFLDMRANEGKELKADILSHISEIKALIPKIQEQLKSYPKDYEQKLTQKLEEYQLCDDESKERLLREIVIFVDKVDISEELSRIESHLKHLQEIIDSGNGSVGKSLDFVIQELNREANTIASKSQNLKITQSALQIKSFIEKIREQVQNVD